MRRFWSTITATRRRKVIALVSAFALTSATTALAAFLVFQGINGSSNGTFSAASISPALTVSNTAPQITGPGDVEAMSIHIVNNDASAQHTLTSLTPTITSTPAACATFLSFSYGTSNPMPKALPASSTFDTVGGTTATGSRVIAAGGMPNSCAGGTYTITWSGTETSP